MLVRVPPGQMALQRMPFVAYIQVARESNQRVLGRGVRGAGGPTFYRGGRGNVDYRPAALLDHARHGTVHSEHRTVQVDAQNPSPDVFGQLSNTLHVVHDAGVVDDHVDAAMG